MQKTIQGKRLLKSHTQANLDKRKWNRKQIWMYVELGSRKWLRFIKLKLYSHPPSWCMMFYHLFNVKWNLAHFTPALAHFTPWVVQFPPWLISPRATLYNNTWLLKHSSNVHYIVLYWTILGTHANILYHDFMTLKVYMTYYGIITLCSVYCVEAENVLNCALSSMRYARI